MSREKKYTGQTHRHKMWKFVAMNVEMQGPYVIKVGTSHLHVCYKGFVADEDLEIL